mgnify:FL=1|jgi:hypothetical protein
MEDLYAKLVKKGRRTLDSIPEEFREKVKARLEAGE